MKKVILASLAMAAFATANAQLNSTDFAPKTATVHDNVQVQVPNVLTLSPSGQSVILASSDLLGGVVSGTQTYMVSSNKEWMASYSITGATGNEDGKSYTHGDATHFGWNGGTASNTDDGDDNNIMPLSLLSMKVTAPTSSLEGGSLSNITWGSSYTPVHTGGSQQFINEGTWGANLPFSLNYQYNFNTWNYMGGIYRADVTVTASQE